MPRDQSEAIVLRSFNVGDQDKIVVLFSREKGLLRAIAKGARKFGNRFGSSLEPMSLVRIFYHEKERQELLTLSSCDLLDSSFEALRDYRTSCTLSYFAELIEEFFPSRAREDILFRLLLSMLEAVKEGGDLDLLSRYFEAWFLQINGLLPDFKRCKKCRRRLQAGGWLAPRMDGVYCANCAPQQKDWTTSEVISFLDWVKKNPPPRKGIAPFAPEQLEAIGRTLQSLIIFHLEKEPKSLHFLK
ncbi:MAG: DNA repair protein RecO [Clostridiales bacterium]|jgi:DNA repair protein RecO (recombination protein O)|nr:DNA repair protein RecO [Clostridiales bacterium]